MSEFVTAVGLVLVIEGLLYALVPARLKSMMEFAREMPDESLRLAGIAAIAAGVAIVWISKQVIGG